MSIGTCFFPVLVFFWGLAPNLTDQTELELIKSGESFLNAVVPPFHMQGPVFYPWHYISPISYPT